MISQLAALLKRAGIKRAGLDFDDEDLADLLWLATKIDPDVAPDRPSPQPRSPQSKPPLPDRQPSGSSNPSPAESSLPLYPPQSKARPQTRAAGGAGIPIQVAAAPPLRRSLELGRALRPLMRKVRSRTEMVLDEDATAAQIAERKIFLPVFQPATERWLDLAVVVEESHSTVIWEKTITAFQKLLERQGAFRDVRPWCLRTTGSGSPQLFAQRLSASTAQPPRSYEELSDPSGRRLILLMSDCTSSIWQNGTIYQWLRDWSIDQPVTVLQLLPARLWERSALGKPSAVQLSALLPGVPNARLIETGFPEWDDRPAAALQLPVVTLEPEALARWASVMAGVGTVQTAGVLVDLTPQTGVLSPVSTETTTLTPEATLQRFRATASRMAQDLAGLMAAVPVSLPIIHLIQETLLPESNQGQVAEVLMSGLLERVEGESDAGADAVQYEFVDETLRDALIDSAPVPNVDAVLEEISQYIARKAGMPIYSYTALLVPDLETSPTTHPDVLPFARIAKRALRRMGGDYAALVQALETTPTPVPVLELSEFPPLREFEFEVATVRRMAASTMVPEVALDIKLQPFEFDVATIDSRWLGELPVNRLVSLLDAAVFANSGNHLTEGQQLVLVGSLANKTYNEMGLEHPNRWSAGQLSRVGAELWKLLTEVLGERVNKTTLQPVVARWAFHQRGIQRQRQTGQHFMEKLAGDVLLEMVQIPAGSFLMGSPDTDAESYDDEKPQHRVTVPSFLMGRYPVTQAQWRAIASQPAINRELSLDPSEFKGDDRPVEKVSWDDATEWCDRLCQLTGKPYRLPTEAEWEYACRAGTTTPFHFGETITTDLANYRGTDWEVEGTTYPGHYGRGFKGIFRNETHPVNSFGIANAFGLADMHGNVWEWCVDQWHENYKEAPTDGSAWFNDLEAAKDDENAAKRLLRGGSWYVSPRSCRSDVRIGDARAIQFYGVGFRVVCSSARTL